MKPRTLVVLIAVLAVMWLALRRQPDAAFLAVSLASVMAVILVALYVRAVRDFILVYPRSIMVAGWAFAALSLVLGLYFSVLAPGTKLNPDPNPFETVPIILGIAVATLPRSVRRYTESLKQKEGQSETSAPPTSQKTSAYELGVSAIFITGENLGAALWLATPWLLVSWISAAATTRFIFGHNSPATFSFSQLAIKTQGEYLAIELVILYLMTLIGLPAVAVGWQNVVIGRSTPGPTLALPNLRSLRMSARLWLFVLLVGLYDKWIQPNAPDVAYLIGIRDVIIVSQLLGAIVSLAVIVLATPFTIGWIALADGKKLDTQESLRLVFRSVGRTIYGGALIALLPFAALLWAAGRINDTLPDSLIDLHYLVFLVAVYIGITPLIAFLTLIYQRSVRQEYAVS